MASYLLYENLDATNLVLSGFAKLRNWMTDDCKKPCGVFREWVPWEKGTGLLAKCGIEDCDQGPCLQGFMISCALLKCLDSTCVLHPQS